MKRRPLKALSREEQVEVFLRLMRAGQNDMQMQVALSVTPKELRQIAVRAGRRMVFGSDSDLPPAA